MEKRDYSEINSELSWGRMDEQTDCGEAIL